MGFVQIIEFRTSRRDEMEQLMEEWEAATEGRRTLVRGLSCTDRDSGSYLQIAEFDSYEAAMKNSELPDTSSFAERMSKLCDDGPTFRNLDVTRVLT